jgi:hypothetical protein
VVVIGLNPDYAFIWVYNTLMLQIAWALWWDI